MISHNLVVRGPRYDGREEMRSTSTVECDGLRKLEKRSAGSFGMVFLEPRLAAWDL